MKQFGPVFALLLALAVGAAACNDADLAAVPSEPEESPEPTPEVEVTPEPGASPTPPLPAEADLAVSVFWDDLGIDWELHLVKPGGRINDALTDCTWTTCIYSSPDWGTTGDSFDDPHKDIDDVDQLGPERIWLADPEAGTFTVMVEHWGAGSADTDGYVEIMVGTDVVTVPMENLPSHHVWTAATIDLPSGVVTTHQTVYDCSADWSAGCLAPLP